MRRSRAAKSRPLAKVSAGGLERRLRWQRSVRCQERSLACAILRPREHAARSPCREPRSKRILGTFGGRWGHSVNVQSSLFAWVYGNVQPDPYPFNGAGNGILNETVPNNGSSSQGAFESAFMQPRIGPEAPPSPSGAFSLLDRNGVGSFCPRRALYSLARSKSWATTSLRSVNWLIISAANALQASTRSLPGCPQKTMIVGIGLRTSTKLTSTSEEESELRSVERQQSS